MLLLRLILFLLTLTSLLAQQDAIREIRVEGNTRVPDSTVLFYLQTRSGDPYDPSALQADFRRILEAGIFRDVRLRVLDAPDGKIVIFQVEERPLVQAVEFPGLEVLTEDEIHEHWKELGIRLSANAPLDESQLHRAEQALRQLLEARSYPLARVDTRLEQPSAAYARVILRVEPGEKVEIGRIDFEGNTVFSDGELRRELKLVREKGLSTLFSERDRYLKEKLQFDLQHNVIPKYTERGHILARSEEPRVEIVEAPRGWIPLGRKSRLQYHITIPISEGPVFRYAGFRVEGVTRFEASRVRDLYAARTGDIVDYQALSRSNQEVKKLYARGGYLDMEVLPEIKPDFARQTAEVLIKVQEGRQFILRHIQFRGNQRTRDKVLRREFFLEEQQIFSSDALERSILRLNQLGLFEEITPRDYQVEKRPELGEVDVLVRVKELDPHSINLTGGLGGTSGSYIGAVYESRNFRGLGQRVEVQVIGGNRTSNYLVSFSDPYWFDSRFSFGLTAFHRRLRFDTFAPLPGADNNRVTLFSRISTGFQVGAGHPLGEFSRAGVVYSFDTNRVENLQPGFRDFALGQLALLLPGGSLEDALRGIRRSEVAPNFVYSTKDRLFGATRGSRFFTQVGVAGGLLGGRINTLRPQLEYQAFLKDGLWNRSVWALRARFEHVRPYGKTPDGTPQTVPFIERIYAGGEFDLRGFDLRSVSPIALVRFPDPDSGGTEQVSTVAVGGDTGILATGEYRIPVYGPLQINGFLDLGSSIILNEGELRLPGSGRSLEILDETNHVWRMSTGAELQFLLPVVNQPFRVIFAYNPLLLDTTLELNGKTVRFREPRTNIRFAIGFTF